MKKTILVVFIMVLIIGSFSTQVLADVKVIGKWQDAPTKVTYSLVEKDGKYFMESNLDGEKVVEEVIKMKKNYRTIYWTLKNNTQNGAFWKITSSNVLEYWVDGSQGVYPRVPLFTVNPASKK